MFEYQPEFEIDMSSLTNRGGKGQDGIQNVSGHVMTVRESIAVYLARDIIDNAVRRTGKKFADIPMVEFHKEVVDRVRGRICSAGEVYAEIGIMQNKALIT